jgi:hypothetical protein
VERTGRGLAPWRRSGAQNSGQSRSSCSRGHRGHRGCTERARLPAPHFFVQPMLHDLWVCVQLRLNCGVVQGKTWTKGGGGVAGLTNDQGCVVYTEHSTARYRVDQAARLQQQQQQQQQRPLPGAPPTDLHRARRLVEAAAVGEVHSGAGLEAVVVAVGRAAEERCSRQGGAGAAEPPPPALRRLQAACARGAPCCCRSCPSGTPTPATLSRHPQLQPPHLPGSSCPRAG